MFSNLAIKEIHIELSEKCNASCPMCARNLFGGKASDLLNYLEITLEDFKHYLPTDLLASIKHISFGGNLGDPATAKDLISILKYCIKVNPNIHLTMESNGGLNNITWWQELATILNSETRYCNFSIDGLETTNHLYRRGVNWNKLHENLKAFTSAGGFANWNYIVFQHNEHQVQKAKIFAHKIGVKSFRIKKSGRFSKDASPSPVYNTQGRFEYSIAPPISSKYRHSKYDLSVVDFTAVFPDELKKYQIEEDFNVEDQVSQISCQSLNFKRLYISASGHLFPCCFLAWPLKSEEKTKEVLQLKNFLPAAELQQISLKKHSYKSILKSHIFKKISESIHEPNSKNTMKICKTTCGNTLCLNSNSSQVE